MSASSSRQASLLLLLGVGLGGCSPFQGMAWWVEEPGSDGVKAVIEVISPAPGDVYQAGETLQAEAFLSHSVEDPAGLTVVLRQGDDEVEGWTLASDGTWTWEVEVQGGLSGARLEVLDTDGDLATAELNWSGNRAPEVSVSAPETDARFIAGEPIPTIASVTDPDVNDPRVLDARWELDGSTVSSGSPDADGVLELNLPGQDVGSHTFLLVATDGVLESSVELRVQVDPPPDTGDTGLR